MNHSSSEIRNKSVPRCLNLFHVLTVSQFAFAVVELDNAIGLSKVSAPSEIARVSET